ncbi:MAG: hypothetical protein WAO35_21140 [Terriglobia bacterium]
MFIAALILIVSTGMFFFYIQAFCQKVLRRQFTQEFFQSIVNANHLEFPSVRKAIEDFGCPMEYPRLTLTLKCDFLALTYLLKNAANVNQRYSYEERLLIVYFKLIFASLAMRHWLKMRERSATLVLTAILEYFGNVVGERVNSVRFGSLTASDYLRNL